jgi:hypothetical protein
VAGPICQFVNFPRQSGEGVLIARAKSGHEGWVGCRCGLATGRGPPFADGDDSIGEAANNLKWGGTEVTPDESQDSCSSQVAGGSESLVKEANKPLGTRD